MHDAVQKYDLTSTISGPPCRMNVGSRDVLCIMNTVSSRTEVMGAS